MIKIESFGLFRLRNNEHYQLMTDFDTLVVKYNATELGIDSLYNPFKVALTAEDAAMRVEQGSGKSKAIEEQDKLRDRTWNAIYTRIKSTQLSPIDEEATSGEAIMRIFDLYGDIRNLSYNEESASLTNLISDLLLPANASHLEKNSITQWVNLLKNQNERFQSLFNERNTEFAGRISGDVRTARKAVDPLYEQMVERINASLVLGTAKTVVTPFVSELNEKLSYYKTTLTTRSSRSKSNEKVETTTDTKG